MAKTYKAIINGKIYADVVHVSSSGMSRRIKFYLVEKNHIVRITHIIAWLATYVDLGEYQQGKKYLTGHGLNVGGCGMDMIFHTLYNCLPYNKAKNWSQNYNTL